MRFGSDLILDNFLDLGYDFLLNTEIWVFVLQIGDLKMLPSLVKLKIELENDILAWTIKDYCLVFLVHMCLNCVYSTDDDVRGDNLSVDDDRNSQESDQLACEVHVFKHFLNFYIILKIEIAINS